MGGITSGSIELPYDRSANLQSSVTARDRYWKDIRDDLDNAFYLTLSTSRVS